VCLALPTFELAPIGLVAFVPLLIALRPFRSAAGEESLVSRPSVSRKKRFWLGWLTGFVFQLVLFRWIPFTLGEMTAFPDALTLSMLALYAAWHGLQIALFAAFVVPIEDLVARRFPALTPVAAALFYAYLEWAFPSLFPWSYGHVVWEVGFIAAPLLSLQGVPLMTAWVILPSALVAALWTRSIRQNAQVQQVPRLRLVVVSVGVAIGVLAFATALRSITLGAPDTTWRVAIIQPNYVLAEKKRANMAMRQRFLERLEGQISSLPPDTYDLVVASEGAFPMWWRVDIDRLDAAKNPQVEATRRVQRAIANGPKAHTIMGGLRHDDDGETRNAAVHLGPDGKILGHYDKKTLVPFSEYVPFADLFPSLKEVKGIGHMAAGEDACGFTAKGGVPVTCGICYESMFAGDTRGDAGDARLLVNLTIDTWFGTSTAPRMHLMSHASRAAELGIPLVRTALTGISALIGPDGQVVDMLGLDVPGILDVTVPLPTGTTVYREVGQVLMPLVGLALALWGAWRMTHRFRRRAA
jgi:apolipoprotein N-acyltransferase